MPTAQPSDEQLIGAKVQQKLNKIVKAAKKEENLSARMFTESTYGCYGLGQSQRSPVRGRERKTSTVGTVESVPTTLSCEVEGIHLTVPSGRDCISNTDAAGTTESQEGSETSGHCQEAHGCRRQRGDLHRVLRRRYGRDGRQGGERACQGRERAKNTRRAQPSGKQPGSALGECRETRAESKTASQGRRNGWRKAISQLAAFCAGRRCVTEEYTRQWPMALSVSNLDVRANTMHWCHSILMEQNFLSPWHAIEQASDLAIEVGTPCGSKVEFFKLPSKRHFADQIVRFCDQVQVIEGDDIEKEFHTSQVPVHSGPWPSQSPTTRWPSPRSLMLGDTGSSGARDTGLSGQEDSQQPVFHFLDRRLPFETPNYIQHLQHLWRERHMRVLDGEYYRLRTWYIHHLHVRQWRRPRIVELEGDGTTWHWDVLQAWRDQLYNNEALNVAVVFPEIRNPAETHFLPHADLILVQGGHDRCGGLATVYLPNSAASELYTWAISFPRHLSGHEILQGAEADHFLQTHAVRIYHDWTPIPTTTTPTHWMLNGHSFVVVVNDVQSTASASSSALPAQADHAQRTTSEEPHQHSQDEDGAERPQEDIEEESTTSDEVVPPIDQLQGVQVFGLGRHTHHCFVHWNSYNTILFEVLRSLGLQRDAAVGYHYFAVPLIDQHPAEEAILLQRVGDIPGGSADRLVLVDITHLAPKGDRPLQQREVLRLPRYLGRVGLLQELGIQEQCDQSDFQCVIHYNNQIWPEDDLAPIQISHAAYVRVEIPPTFDCQSPERARPSKRAHIHAPAAGDLRGVSQGPALYQVDIKLSHKQPVTNSATFPSLRAVPHPHSTAADRRSPVQTHEQGWLPQASMAFLQCATTEYQDEGPVIHWMTWYLHHQRYTRNSESRLLRLDGLQHLWFQDLCELWSDVMDPNIPGRVHHVHPFPPTDDRHSDHEPGSKRRIKLTTLVSADGTSSVVRLQAGHQELQLPSFLEVPLNATEVEVENALLQWGIDCTAIQFGNHDQFLCFQSGFAFDTKMHHYMFTNEDEEDKEGCILHSQPEVMSYLDIMKFLDGIGYARAVVINVKDRLPGIQCVTFCNSVPQPPVKDVRDRQRTPWPTRTVRQWQEGPLFRIPAGDQDQGPHQVHTGFDNHDVLEFLAAGDSFLQTDFSGLELPDYIQERLRPSTPGYVYDRWLIFTDGSSQAATRRMAPQQADDLGQPDTWALLVLGEIFNEDGTSVVEAIGWCAHPVRYDADGACFTHARRIGAEVAERQAPIWAGMWRLAQNSLTLTVFCCDSLTSGQQAFGQMGTALPDDSFRLLRGIFQCLELGLPTDHLTLHHVYSHTGDPFNEFVDTVAKLEMTKSFHHAWPHLDMRKWNRILPHFWLIFGETNGLPQWNNGVLQTPTPHLPGPMTEMSDTEKPMKPQQLRCTLSLVSANVLSISRNPAGHAGKLHYLYAQMKTFGINILGIQEGRADEGMTSAQKVLRLMAGHERGQGGVEIWVNLEQPYGRDLSGTDFYFKEHHFQVLHKDCRRLLVNVQAEGLQCFLFAAHAPHSGRPRDERENWWDGTVELLLRHNAQHSCIWLIDANAEPGGADGEAVHCKGLRTSANTIFMRTALQRLNLYIPSTTDIHEGPRETWTAPNGDDRHCIDYIILPTHWRPSCRCSRVLEDFDLATSRDDHKAVSVEIVWQTEVFRAARHKSPPQIEWASIEVRNHVASALRDVQCVPWRTDVASQEQSFSRQIARILRPLGRTVSAGPKKCYIDEETWLQRRTVLGCRKQLKRLKEWLRKEAMYIVFEAWRSKETRPDFIEAFNYGTTLRCCSIRTFLLFTFHRKRLRSMLQKAKAQLMHQRLQQVTEHTAASQILRLLRDFTGPTNPRKQKRKTLPMVEDQHGHLCTTPWAARQAWIAFFADMEGGHRQSYSELHTDWVRSLQEEALESFDISVQQLPTLTDLELAFRRVASGKATGPDGVPGELCHFGPTQCARVNFSALWKLILHGHEALQYKGGLLVQAYKGSGEQTQCSSFRSLLISSHVGKALHRTMRSSQAAIFESFLQKQQLGGRRAMPVTYGVHLVRAFLRQAKFQDRSSALILLDLKEAFYRILYGWQNHRRSVSCLDE